MQLSAVEQGIAQVVQGLRRREPEIVASMLARNVDEVPGLRAAVGDEDLAGAISESARTNLRDALAALGGDRRPPEHLSSGALEEAREAARAGMPLPSLLHTYRVGHGVVWEAIIEEIDAVCRVQLRR
jgi:hypothetical protein